MAPRPIPPPADIDSGSLSAVTPLLRSANKTKGFRSKGQQSSIVALLSVLLLGGRLSSRTIGSVPNSAMASGGY